jgi:hypothetical protein
MQISPPLVAAFRLVIIGEPHRKQRRIVAGSGSGPLHSAEPRCFSLLARFVSRPLWRLLAAALAIKDEAPRQARSNSSISPVIFVSRPALDRLYYSMPCVLHGSIEFESQPPPQEGQTRYLSARARWLLLLWRC